MVGIDRFEVGHDQGSSHGQTRIIRQAYFEHPNYVPLVVRAYELWAELEASFGRKLLHPVGLLQVGPPGGKVLSGVLASAARHGLEVEQLTRQEIEARWPGFRISPSDMQGVFERRAGFLEVENCVRAQVEAAEQLGATTVIGEPVRRWNVDRGLVKVQTDSSVFTAKRLILVAGAWASQMLSDVGISFRVLRKPMFWFRTEDSTYEPRHCPCFLFETCAGEFYGFPQVEPFGVKVAEHSGGEAVSDPARVSRELDPKDLERVEEFARTCLPALGSQMSHHAVCMYTMSPDLHFVIDRHPRHESVLFVAGLSGHGFKFAPVLGEAVAELALEGKTGLPIGFLAADRFGRLSTA